MKIINNNRILYTNVKPNTQIKPKTLNTDNYKNNAFYRYNSISNELSFRGIQYPFKNPQNIFPEIEVLPKVSDKFASKITKQINIFSPEWLKKFRDENYKIILAQSFYDAYKSQGIFDPVVFYSELMNSKGTLGVTYSTNKNGKNFFAFCDKPPYSDKYMPSIINHEFAHGIVNILGLDKNKKTFEMIKKDTELIIKDKKLDKLTPNERKMLSHYFFKQNAYMPVDELCADLIAWNCGGGLYGSGLVLDVDNSNLMQGLFPNLSKFINTVKP